MFRCVCMYVCWGKGGGGRAMHQAELFTQPDLCAKPRHNPSAHVTPDLIIHTLSIHNNTPHALKVVFHNQNHLAHCVYVCQQAMMSPHHSLKHQSLAADTVLGLPATPPSISTINANTLHTTNSSPGFSPHDAAAAQHTMQCTRCACTRKDGARREEATGR